MNGPGLIQRLLAAAAVLAVMVLFYQNRLARQEQSRLEKQLEARDRATDSLSAALYAASGERGLLKAENELKKLEVARANEVLDHVLSNMEAIAQREAEARSLLAVNAPERRGRLISARDYRKIDHEINGYLEAMYTTLNMSRQRVDELEGELESSLDDNEQLKLFVGNLRRMVDSQDQTIRQLREEKEKLLAQLARYEEENEALRRAWVAVGTRTELRDRKLVRKPFLRALEVLPFDSTRYTPFDAAAGQLKLAERPVKDVSILSEHRRYPEFFSVSADGRTLTLKDPLQFWRVSKFLIVEVEY